MSRKTVITCANCPTTRECDANDHGYSPPPGDGWTEVSISYGVKPPPQDTSTLSPQQRAYIERAQLVPALTVALGVIVDLCPVCTSRFAKALQDTIPVAAKKLDEAAVGLQEGRLSAQLPTAYLRGGGGFAY